jgi:hypothetical protein
MSGVSPAMFPRNMLAPLDINRRMRGILAKVAAQCNAVFADWSKGKSRSAPERWRMAWWLE